MSSEWFDIAYINYDEAILHGRINEGRDEFGCMKEREVRVVLTEAQKDAIVDLNERHCREREALLRTMA